MTMKEIMKSSMQRYENSKSDRVAWNNIQTKVSVFFKNLTNFFPQLKCCGVEGPSDWPENTRPVTCCHATREGVEPPEAHHCRAAKPQDEILYVDGCFYQLQEKAESAAKILIGVGIGIAFVEVKDENEILKKFRRIFQVIGIILACWLASAVKNKD